MAKVKSKTTKAGRLPGPTLPKAKTVNPFSFHQNRKKFNIIGQSKKGSTGLLTVSRQRATDNRNSTLLIEYMNRNKSNVFVDQRIGEKRKDIDEQEKMELRRIKEVKKKIEKKSLYNLSEETEEHLETTEATAVEYGMNPFSDDEDGDGMVKEDGMLDAAFVRRQHFGGGDFQEPAGVSSASRQHLSARDREAEIIAASKKRREEAKDRKELHYKNIKSLDSQFSHFMKLMSGNLTTPVDGENQRKESQGQSFNTLMRKLNTEVAGGQASDRLKTKEEIAKLQAELEQKDEEERLKRMKPDFEEDALKTRISTRSVDTLDAGTVSHFESRPTLSYQDGHRLLAEEDLFKEETRNKLSKKEKQKIKKQRQLELKMNEEDMRLREEIGKSEEHLGEGEDVDSEEEEEEEEEDQFSDILDDDSNSDCDEYKDTLKDNNENTLESCKKEEKLNRRRTAQELKEQNNADSKSKKRVSFTIPTEDEEAMAGSDSNPLKLPAAGGEDLTKVPASFKALWSLIEGLGPSAVSELLAGMIEHNSPDIRHSNVMLCATLFQYILQLAMLPNTDNGDNCSPIISSSSSSTHVYQDYLEVFVPLLHKLAKLIPVDAAKEYLLVFIQKRDEYRNSRKKRYPMLDTLILLQIGGRLFPPSDFHHPALTPVKALLRQLMGQANIRDTRGTLAAVYVAALMLDYERDLGRYCSELVFLLQGLLLRCVPVDAANRAAAKQKLNSCVDTRQDDTQQLNNNSIINKKVTNTKSVNSQSAINTKRRKRTKDADFTVTDVTDQDGGDSAVNREVLRTELNSTDSTQSNDGGPTYTCIPLQWLASPLLPHHNLLVLQGDCSKCSVDPVNVLLLNEPNLQMTDALRCAVLQATLKMLSDLLSPSFSDGLPSLHTALSCTTLLLPLLPLHRYPATLQQQVLHLQQQLQQGQRKQLYKLRVDRGRPKPLRMFEPLVYDMRVGAPSSMFNKSEGAIKKYKLEKSIKKERKGAKREIVKDTKYLAELKLKETIASDTERKRKVNLIMNELRHQEGEHIKYHKTKPGAR